MSTATILFLVLAAAAIFFAYTRENIILGILGGVMIAVGLGTVFPHWIAATKAFFDATGVVVWHWFTTAFTAATTPTGYTLLVVLAGAGVFFWARKKKAFILGIIGAIVAYGALATFLPHLGPSTVTALTAEWKIIVAWFSTAF